MRAPKCYGSEGYSVGVASGCAVTRSRGRGSEARGLCACSGTAAQPRNRATAQPRLQLLVSQRVDRVELRGFARRVEAEEDSDRRGDDERDDDRLRTDDDRPLDDALDQLGHADTEEHA